MTNQAFLAADMKVIGTITFRCSSLAASSRKSAATALPFAPRRPYESHPLQLRHFSGHSRAIRRE